MSSHCVVYIHECVCVKCGEKNELFEHVLRPRKIELLIFLPPPLCGVQIAVNYLFLYVDRAVIFLQHILTFRHFNRNEWN